MNWRSREHPIHYLIQQTYDQLGIEIGTKPHQHRRAVSAIFKVMLEKNGADFEFIYEDTDKAFSLEELIRANIKRKYLVACGQKSHHLHGVLLSPFDNFLHDVAHALLDPYPVDPKDPEYLRTILYENTLEAILDQFKDHQIYKQLIVVVFRMRHETFKKRNISPLGLYAHLHYALKTDMAEHETYWNQPDLETNISDGQTSLSDEELMHRINLSARGAYVERSKEYIRVTNKEGQSVVVNTLRYNVQNAKDLYWRLKYCGADQGLDAPQTILDLERGDSAKEQANNDRAKKWLKALYAREQSLIEYVLGVLERQFIDSPLEKTFNYAQQMVTARNIMLKENFEDRLELCGNHLGSVILTLDQEYDSEFEAIRCLELRERELIREDEAAREAARATASEALMQGSAPEGMTETLSTGERNLAGGGDDGASDFDRMSRLPQDSEESAGEDGAPVPSRSWQEILEEIRQKQYPHLCSVQPAGDKHHEGQDSPLQGVVRIRRKLAE